MSDSPPELYDAAGNVLELLPSRARSAHKGHYGHVLVVGGNAGMSGAVRMAGEAAARVGAGWVSIATHPSHAAVINSARPELMCHAVAGPCDLNPLVEKATVIAVGPGLGRSAWAQTLLGRVLECRHPLVVDADALNLLALDPFEKKNWVLTPHPGEAARLLDCATADVETDRVRAVHEIQNKYGGMCVLKGAGTLVCGGVGPVVVFNVGNPGMASGGMGDILTGVIAGLIAQGLSLADAAKLGVYLHGHAGDLAAADGERGLLATDLLQHLRRLVNPAQWR